MENKRRKVHEELEVVKVGYANGVAETMMGNALQKIFQTMPDVTREDLVITTKIFFGVKRPLYYPNRVGLSRKHIIEGLKQSLKRMQLDFVDVVFDTQEDRGVLGEKLISPGSANQNQIPCDFSDINQFCLDDFTLVVHNAQTVTVLEIP